MTDLPSPEINLANNLAHLFRHASEITKETKGGYLSGVITLPRTPIGQFIRLSLAPAMPDPTSNPLNLHPLLLHINMKENKRQRQMEIKNGSLPSDVDWSFVMFVDPADGSVYKVDDKARPRFQQNKERTEAKIESRKKRPEQIRRALEKMKPQELPSYERDLKNFYTSKLLKAIETERPFNQGPLVMADGWKLSYKLGQMSFDPDNPSNPWALDLGTSGLMLNVITPLQKYLNSGITVVDVLTQRFKDLHQKDISDTLLNEVEAVFNRKEDRVNLQRVRLNMEVFHANDLKFNSIHELQSPQTMTSDFKFVSAVFSDSITNSKSKDCGPIKLYDINPRVSCCQGNVRVHILSHFKLSAEVKARFIVVDPRLDQEQNIMSIAKGILNQPEPKECYVFNQFVLMFNSPQQDYEKLKEHIYDKGYEIRLTAYRLSDSRMSSTSFEFIYKPHGWSLSNNTPCGELLIPPTTTSPLDLSRPGTLALSAISRTNTSSENINISCVTCELLKIPEEKQEVKKEATLPNARPGKHRRVQDQYLTLDDSTEEISSHKKPKYEVGPSSIPTVTIQSQPQTSTSCNVKLGGVGKFVCDGLRPTMPPLIPLTTLLTPVPSLQVCNTENQIVVKKEPDDILVIKKEHT